MRRVTFLCNTEEFLKDTACDNRFMEKLLKFSEPNAQCVCWADKQKVLNCEKIDGGHDSRLDNMRDSINCFNFDLRNQK